jgi:hypothetical protein
MAETKQTAINSPTTSEWLKSDPEGTSRAAEGMAAECPAATVPETSSECLRSLRSRLPLHRMERRRHRSTHAGQNERTAAMHHHAAPSVSNRHKPPLMRPSRVVPQANQPVAATGSGSEKAFQGGHPLGGPSSRPCKQGECLCRCGFFEIRRAFVAGRIKACVFVC